MSFLLAGEDTVSNIISVISASVSIPIYSVMVHEIVGEISITN